jgi:hypothetical protein
VGGENMDSLIRVNLSVKKNSQLMHYSSQQETSYGQTAQTDLSNA